MKRPTAAVLATTALLLSITACTPSTPDPTDTPTPSASTPSPTPTAGAVPTQVPTPPPTDQTTAVTAATHAYEGYLAASLDLLKDPSLGVEYMSGFVLPNSQASQVIEDTVRSNAESGLRASGGPFGWQTNTAMSFAAPATVGDDRNDVGSVQLFGCGDNSQVTFTNPDIAKGVAPHNVAVVYVPQVQAWLVQSDDQLQPGEEGAPQC